MLFISFEIYGPRTLLPREKNSKWIYFDILVVVLLGVLFGYYVVTPFPFGFGQLHCEYRDFNDFDLSSYTALVRASVLASGIIFELPILVYFLTKIGLITPEFMRKYRKIALVLVMFLSAVITPPDVASQIIVAIPVLILYELSIFISKRVIRNMNKKAHK